MPRLLSNENIQLIFSAKDRTRAALKSMNSGLKGVANRAKGLFSTLTQLTGRGIIRGLNRTGGAIRSAFSEIANLAGGGGLIGAGGLVAGTSLLTAQGTEAAAELTKYAQALNGTTTQVQTIVGVLGGQREDSLELLKNIRERIQEAAAEESGVRDAFNAIGIGTPELQRLAGADIEQQFFRFADAIKAADEASVGTFRSLELVSEEGFKAFNRLAEGADVLRQRIPGLQALGLIVDEETIARSNRLAKTFDLVKNVFSALSLEVSGRLAPIIENLLSRFLAFVSANGGVGQLVSDTFDLIVVKARQVGEFLGRILKATREIIGDASEFLGFDESLKRAPERLVEFNNQIKSLREEISRLENEPSLTDRVLGVENTLDFRRNSLETLIQARSDLLERFNAQNTEAESLADDSNKLFGVFNFELDQSEINEAKERVNSALAEIRSSIAAGGSIPSTANTPSLVDTVVTDRDLTGFRTRVQDLRASFSEVEQIQREYARVIDEIASIPAAAFGDGDQDSIVQGITERRDQALQQLAARAAEERNNALTQYQKRLAEIAQQEAEALDISSVVQLAVPETQLQQGLRSIQEAFDQEQNQIEAAVSLSEPAKQRLLGELQQFKEQAEQGLTINALINRITDGLDTASSLTSSVGQLLGGDTGETEAFRQRADEIISIRERLQQAFANGNRAEVQSLQTKIQNLTRLQKAEEAVQKKRFERDKKFRLATAIMDTAAAGLKAFRSAPWPANFGAMATALAAGAVQVKSILDQKYQSPSVGSISGGVGSSGTGSGSTSSSSPSAAQLQQTGTTTVQNRGTLTVQIPPSENGVVTDEQLDAIFEGIADGFDSQRYDQLRFQRTGT